MSSVSHRVVHKGETDVYTVTFSDGEKIVATKTHPNDKHTSSAISVIYPDKSQIDILTSPQGTIAISHGSSKNDRKNSPLYHYNGSAEFDRMGAAINQFERTGHTTSGMLDVAHVAEMLAHHAPVTPQKTQTRKR